MSKIPIFQWQPLTYSMTRGCFSYHVFTKKNHFFNNSKHKMDTGSRKWRRLVRKHCLRKAFLLLVCKRPELVQKAFLRAFPQCNLTNFFELTRRWYGNLAESSIGISHFGQDLCLFLFFFNSNFFLSQIILVHAIYFFVKWKSDELTV